MPTLDFSGKQLVYSHHLTVPSRTLETDAGKSLLPKGGKPSVDGNLIIHGDNLQALKALMPQYAGRVNCVYIDPPYNTGHEGWIYNDNVNSPLMKEWLKGKSPVEDKDLERHDKWLCMMWPRLNLLRELLAEDGVIFVSIDDNEQHRLRMVMDEIFGEGNFRNEIAVRRYNKNISRQFIEKGMHSLAVGFERILVYANSPACLFNPVYREATQERGEFGYWKGFWNAADRPTMRYTLLGVTPEDGQWKWKKSVAKESVENYNEYLANYSHISLEEYWDQTGQKKKFIRRRKGLSKGRNKGVEHWVSPSEGILLSSDWTDLLASERHSKGFQFDAPKNVGLIRRLIEMATSRFPNAFVLDSFAGSGTTAQAVLELNKEDGGNRKFILVECEDKIANKITAERVRRVIKGIPKAKDENLKKGLGGSFTYCTLGEEISVENMLTGKKLPSYETLARFAFRTATGRLPDKIRKARGKDGFFHETDDRLFYLIYEPNLDFLSNDKSALNDERAKRIEKEAKKKKKTAVVFATHKFIGQKELSGMGIVFVQIPYGIKGVN